MLTLICYLLWPLGVLLAVAGRLARAELGVSIISSAPLPPISPSPCPAYGVEFFADASKAGCCMLAISPTVTVSFLVAKASRWLMR